MATKCNMATGKQWVTFIHLLVLVAVAFPGHCLSGDWTWVSGTGLVNQVGIYGTKGVGAGSNVPSARSNSATWRDGLGRFWLFGGIVGRQPNFTAQDLYNDLWRFDGTNWTWVSCSKTAGAVGNYGTKGVAAATNVPGARTHAVTWTENNGFLWLFGGSSAVAQDTMKIWNDLWKFDGVNWTWVSGSNVANGAASYGTKGVAASTNVPGARLGSVTWRDNANKLWLFGGMRNGNTTIDHGLMNDLWKFDGVNWIWVSGANTAAGTVSTAVYGTKGLASATNIPGGRTDAVSWVDSNNYLWLFGGKGVDSSGNAGTLNDLWRYNVATNQWTWISGANVIQQTALYGTKGVPSSTARPGCRVLATAWTDSSNNLWLFGGLGSAVAGTVGWLNDLWKFDGTYWTWVSGSNTYAEQGTYGIKGVSATSNVPGARMLGNVFSSDDKTSLWLFGGWGVDGGGKGGQLNDLWKFTP